MGKIYFTDKIKTETLAKLIDEKINFEKTAKSRDIKTNLLKIVPAVAAIVLVIGLVNIFSVINNNGTDGNGNRDYPGAVITSEPATEAPAPTTEETSELIDEHPEFTETETLYHEDGSYTIFELDENGNVIKATSHNADGSISQWQINEYDENGNRIKSIGYNADGTIYSADGTMKWWLEFDADDNAIKRTVINADGSIFQWSELEYDENGNNIKHTVYNADGSLNSWEEYEYDENGNLTKTTNFDARGNIMWESGD
jgi:hypothetical protein